MSILWHWTSDVWLWVLAKLNLGPVVVEMTRESGIWMSVLWHWTSDVWLWVLAKLKLSPVIVEMAGES